MAPLSRVRHADSPMHVRASAIAVVVLLFWAAGVEASSATDKCLAQKRGARGEVHECSAADEARRLGGQPGVLDRCLGRSNAKFQ